jgi:hypothetical protein
VHKYMKSLLLLAGMGSLTLTVACGAAGNGGGFGSGGGGNGFSNSSLSGQYAYQISGFDLQTGNPFREAGVFTADGSGHITSGVDDFGEGGIPTSNNVTGTYSVSSDGTAALSFTFPGGDTTTFALALAGSSKLYMIEADTSGFVASGMALKQDTTAFNSVPTGTYVFRMHDITVGSRGSSSSNEVGAFTIAGNGSVSGNVDSDRNFLAGQSTISGNFNFPSATNGRGTATFTDSSNGTSTSLYYVVDASHLLFFSTDATIVGNGQAEKQSGTFTNASLAGAYALGSVGDTANNIIGVNVAGRFNADGAGNISLGTLDQVEDGVATDPANPPSFTGTYTVAGTGRADITLNATNGNFHEIAWLVNPTRAFFLTSSASEVEDGTISAQTGAFSSASLNGSYAFNMTGIDGTAGGDTNDFVGTLSWNGTSSVTMRTIVNVTGSITNPTNFPGTYTVSSNGRAVGSLNGISNNLVFYLISPTDAYILENDTNIEIQGSMSKQQ